MVSSLIARCIIVTIGTLYPGYRSYKSLINSDLREVVNCLRYWIVFAIFIACETVTDLLLSWFPFYYWIKICIVLWMISPAGSTLLYKRFVQPVLKEREREIDELLEQTKQKGYSTLLDLTNKGFRYASNVFLNTAVLGQAYLGEHLKRSLSTSDINNGPIPGYSNPHATLHEEEEDGTDLEFSKRLRDDRKYLSKGNVSNTRRPVSQHQEKSDDLIEDPLAEFEMSKVMARKPRTANRTGQTAYSSSENSHIGTISKRQVSKVTSKKSSTKPVPSVDYDANSSDNDDVNANMSDEEHLIVKSKTRT